MLPFHPYADLFPLIEGDQFAELVADVKVNDLREKIVVWDGAILDGRNRYRAALAAELIEEDDGPDRAKYFVRFVPSVDGDPLAYVISKNLRRRHLDDNQRASVAGKIANLSRGRPTKGGPEKPPIGGLSTEQAAAALNVAPRQVERARVVHDQGIPEVGEALDRGALAVSVAEKIARLPEQEQPQALAKALPNGARAIMGSRQEPSDSLDYFPTPPWATRALMEVVMPKLGVIEFNEAWEPACGEGHIAEVLCEYFDDVLASDIHDYGFGHQCEKWEQGDFLKYETLHKIADWVITNPPFKDKAEQFVLQALSVARVGVAMFFRLQWLETNGRYERIFEPYPPTMIAQFAERVPLCKGEWKPDGDTATAYLWIIWHKHSPSWQTALPTLFTWIPPGQRKALTRPDDEARFTSHPVIGRKHFDPSSGEILPLHQGTESQEREGVE
jgi:hypothetical protein